MRNIVIATIVILLVSLALQRTYTPKDPGLSVWFLNVGQGASILIRTSSNHFLLFDGGPGAQVLSELGEVLAPSQRKLDVVALSHPHADHIRGLISVVQRYQVGEVWSSGSTHSSGDYAAWIHILEDKQLPHTFWSSAQTAAIGSAEVRVLHPPQPVVGKEFSQTHDGNLSLKVSQTGRSILLAGDVAEKQELSMLSSCQVPTCTLTSDILQVAHHGSASGTTEKFLIASTPRVAVIPVGAQNKFKHPRDEVLERLSTAKVAIWRTDTDGRVQLILLPTETTVTSTTGRSATYPLSPQPAPT